MQHRLSELFLGGQQANTHDLFVNNLRQATNLLGPNASAEQQTKLHKYIEDRVNSLISMWDHSHRLEGELNHERNKMAQRCTELQMDLDNRINDLERQTDARLKATTSNSELNVSNDSFLVCGRSKACLGR